MSVHAMQRSCKGHDGRVRARQNLKMLKITQRPNESTNQVILSISKISARARMRARYAHTQRQIAVSFP